MPDGTTIRAYQAGDEAAVVSLWQRCGLTRPWNDPAKDIARKLTVQPGLLAIQHLGVDTRLDAGNVNWITQSLPRVDIEGSDGLTLNLTADARYKLSDTWALEASFGSPLVTREARPDGLTRALVANMGLRFAF